MYHISWALNLMFLVIIISMEGVLCSLDGTFVPRRRNPSKPATDPCNPLYWYPRNIPEYCYYKKDITEKQDDLPPVPVPIAVPMPPMLPVPMPPMLPVPMPPMAPVPMPPMSPVPLPSMPIPVPIPQPVIAPQVMPLPYPLPFGIPLAPTSPMLPVAGIPLAPQPMPMYPPPPPPPVHPLPRVLSPFASYVPPYGIQRKPMSMVPGLPGLVAPDGGINILPFSDAYADLLERHKQKMIRKRLQKFLDEYDGFPSRNSCEDMKHYHNDDNNDDNRIHV